MSVPRIEIDQKKIITRIYYKNRSEIVVNYCEEFGLNGAKRSRTAILALRRLCSPIKLWPH